MSLDLFDVFVEAVEMLLKEHPKKTQGFTIMRPASDGWIIAGGPRCNFFVGVSEAKDGSSWLVYGPVARRTVVTSDDEDEFTESCRYSLQPSGRTRLAETPLDDGTDLGRWWDYFTNLHSEALGSLRNDDLLYDGWIVWSSELRDTVVTLPSPPEA